MEFKQFELDDTLYTTQLTRKYKLRKKYVERDLKKIFSVIPGTILELFVKQGQHVKRGDSLLILEAMKMKNTVTAPVDGIIKVVHVYKDEKVPKNFLMIEIE